MNRKTEGNVPIEPRGSVLFGPNGGLTLRDLSTETYRNKFSDYLPWVAYDDRSKIYSNIDETDGFVWECTPLAFAGEKTVSILEGLFRIFPDGTVLQFILCADPYIDPFLEMFKRTKTRAHPIIEKTTAAVCQFFKEGTGGIKKLSGIPVRNFRLFVAVKIPRAVKNVNLQDMFGMPDEILRGAGLCPVPLPPDHFLDWLRRLFNDRPSLNNHLFSDNIPLRKQIIFSETEIRKSTSSIKIGEKIFRCTTPKVCPKEIDPLQTNQLAGGIWGMISDSDQIRTPFLYVLNIVFENLYTKIHTKCNATLQQQGWGSLAPSLGRKKEEYLWATDELEKGTRFIRVLPICWVWGREDQQVIESITRVKRLWESQGYVMQEDRGILTILFLSSLPFGLYNQEKNIDNLDRDFIVPSSSVSPILPVQADFMGGGAPILPFISRKGQFCGLDIFDPRANNNNLLVAAGTGAGKSFLVNYITYNYYACNALIRIIDIGGSYKKMAKKFNGVYLDFGKESRVCLNPFSNVKDLKEDLSIISAIILQMAFSATGSVPPENAETIMTLIRAAAKWAYEEQPENQHHIDLVYEYMRSFPEHAGDLNIDLPELIPLSRMLAFNLMGWTTKGDWGRWVNGKSTFDISNDEFVVLELEHLKPQKELFKVITLQVINDVTQDLYLSDRSRRRMITFEEAWQFVGEGGETVALEKVMEGGYRRARKYYGSFNIVVQSILDRLKFGSVGNVIWANSAFKFYLESTDFDKAREEKLIDYDEFTMRLLKSTSSNKPKYSEIFVDSPFGKGVVRLVVDPLSYQVYTSNPQEVAAIERLVGMGRSYEEAMAEMAKG
ncbi:MAG: TraC family protein [Candidatus Manganitrophaceae bacterium]